MMSRVVLSIAAFLALLLVLPDSLSVTGQQPGESIRSTVIYPAERIALRMDHSHPAHVGLPCVRCHVGATSSRSSRDSLLPTEAQCAPCHDAEMDRASAAARCETCHLGERADGRFAVEPSHFPTARLTFSHEAHLGREMRCEDCHSRVRERQVATRQDLPSMRSCFQCHGARGNATASTACRTCHLVRPNGKLRVRYPEGNLVPPHWLDGMGHDRDFLVRHRWVAADSGQTCMTCHEEQDCSDCHDGRVRRSTIHPNDFLTTHPAEARRNESRCTSCHTVQRFCGECHARLGIAPASASLAGAGAPFHPPGFDSRHGLEARRALTTCASCHSERDCVVCHGTMGAAGPGVSPHPAGYAERCRSDFARNSRACVMCHGESSFSLSRCE